MKTDGYSNIGHIQTPRRLAPGALLFEAYEVLEFRGSGAMGAVYKCREVLNRDNIVAVKLMALPSKDEVLISRISIEARALHLASSAHVVKLIDICRTDTHVGLVQEFVDGRSLEELIEEESLALCESEGETHAPAIDYAWALDVMIQVARGINSLHARYIVHRDIKAANILIDQAGRVKLSDLGLAFLIYDHKQEQSAGLQGRAPQTLDTRITSLGDLIGTPAYVAPEFIEHGEFDERSDQYSFAIVCYELCTGSCPYAEDSLYRMLERKISMEPPNIREVAPACPREISQVVMKALRRCPDDRFPSMFEMLRALELARQCLYGEAKEHKELVPPSVSTLLSAALARPTLAQRLADLWHSFTKQERLAGVLLLLMGAALAGSPLFLRPTVTIGPRPLAAVPVSEQQSLVESTIEQLISRNEQKRAEQKLHDSQRRESEFAKRQNDNFQGIAPERLPNWELGNDVGWRGGHSLSPQEQGVFAFRDLHKVRGALRLPVQVVFESGCRGVDRYYIKRDMFLASDKELVLSVESLAAEGQGGVQLTQRIPAERLSSGFNAVFHLPPSSEPRHLGVFLCSALENGPQSCRSQSVQDFSKEDAVARRKHGQKHFLDPKLYYFSYLVLHGERVFYLRDPVENYDPAELSSDFAIQAGTSTRTYEAFEEAASLSATLNAAPGGFRGAMFTIALPGSIRKPC